MNILAILCQSLGIDVDESTPRDRIAELIGAHEKKNGGRRDPLQRYLFFPSKDLPGEASMAPRRISWNPNEFGGAMKINEKITGLFRCRNWWPETLYSEVHNILPFNYISSRQSDSISTCVLGYGRANERKRQRGTSRASFPFSLEVAARTDSLLGTYTK